MDIRTFRAIASCCPGVKPRASLRPLGLSVPAFPNPPGATDALHASDLGYRADGTIPVKLDSPRKRSCELYRLTRDVDERVRRTFRDRTACVRLHTYQPWAAGCG